MVDVSYLINMVYATYKALQLSSSLLFDLIDFSSTAYRLE